MPEEQKTMMQFVDEAILSALENFKKQYPLATSGDLQTFVIGCEAGVKIATDVFQNRMEYKS